MINMMIYLFTTVIVHSYVKERESIHEKVDGLAIFNPGHATWWQNPSLNLRGKCTADIHTELWGLWVFDKKDVLTIYGIFPKCLCFWSSDIIIMWAQFPSHAVFFFSEPKTALQPTCFLRTLHLRRHCCSIVMASCCDGPPRSLK